MPRLAIAVVLLALVALASTMTYTGYLVVGVLADYLDIGRVMTGLLLGALFARLPWVRQGKLRTVGLLPKRARRPLMVSLLAFCLLSFLYRGEMVPALFVAFAATFIITFPTIRQRIVSRTFAPFFKSRVDPRRPKSTDDTVIDVEFREKKD